MDPVFEALCSVCSSWIKIILPTTHDHQNATQLYLQVLFEIHLASKYISPFDDLRRELPAETLTDLSLTADCLH